MKRRNNPNKGLLSPPGGKLHTDKAESPYACAVREASEECNLVSDTRDWTLRGIVTERDYPNIGNIMLFVFEYKKSVEKLPEESLEGVFYFVHPKDVLRSNIPETDKLYLWKFVLKNNDSMFSVHIDCTKEHIEGVVEHE